MPYELIVPKEQGSYSGVKYFEALSELISLQLLGVCFLMYFKLSSLILISWDLLHKFSKIISNSLDYFISLVPVLV